MVLCVAYGIQFSFGVFMPAIEAETGWNRTSLSGVYSLYVFLYGALGLITGQWTDQWGPRMVLAAGGCLLGIGIMLTSQVHALWQFYLCFGVIAAAGMSAAYVPCNATVVRWFIERRGLALSITSSGSSCGSFLVPPLSAVLLTIYGWRTTYLVLAVFGAVVINLCATFVVRNPEKMGLLPDGRTASDPHDFPSSTASALSDPEGMTLAEARRTSTFWMLNGVFTLTWLVVFIPLAHGVPFALDLGIPPTQAAFIISTIGFAGLTGRLLMGPISDRAGRIPALGFCLLLQALAFVGFSWSTGLLSLLCVAAMFGFSYAGGSMLFPAIVGDYFGRLAVGAIVGFLFAIAGSAAAVGPLVAGYIYQTTGRYDAAFLLGAALNLAAFVLMLFLKKPDRVITQ